MRQILVAIDFSKCAVHSLEYAISIANRIKADILMVYVDNTTSNESIFQESPFDYKKEIIANFQELMEKYESWMEHGKLSYKLRKGKVHHEIANQAKYIDAFLIVTGTHGVSGFEEFWIGSNAYRIVTYAPCPVITIRTNYTVKEKVDKIILPIDSSLETRQKLPFTSQFARFYNSKIHIVSLYSTSIKAIQSRVDDYTKQVEKYLEDVGVQFVTEIIEAENITKSTIDYAESVEADIISIMTEQETTTASLFLGAYAQQMVNHSSIPVLSIKSKEFIRIG